MRDRDTTMGRCRPWRSAVGILLAAAFLVPACGYHHFAAPLQPAADQASPVVVEGRQVVAYLQGLEIAVTPVMDVELNRRFASHSQSGPRSTNPYTFADVELWPPGPRGQRFTVLSLEVENEGFPKVKIDPAKIVLRTDTGREYWSLSVQQLDVYYRAYTAGYQGDAYNQYRERMDVLSRTTYRNEEVFVDQQKSGYVVFPVLDRSVSQVSVVLHDVVLRFDYRNEPVEAVDVEYRFERDIGRIWEDGRVVLKPRRTTD